MPHVKVKIVKAVHAANSALAGADPSLVLDATTLAELANAIELSGDDLETIDHLYPEAQEVILQAIKIAAAASRPVYLTWRHSAIQRVEITVPSSGVPDAPMDISIHSRYDDDGLGSPAAS